MKKFVTFLVTALTILAGFILESTVLPHISLAGIKPNIMLIVTVSYGFLLGERRGLFVGFTSGLLCDIFFGPMLGFEAFVYGLIGFLCGKFKKYLYVEDLAFPVLITAISDFIYCFLNFVFLFLLRNRLFLGTFLLQIVLPEMIYTALFATFIYPFLTILYNRYMKESHHTAPGSSVIPQNIGRKW